MRAWLRQGIFQGPQSRTHLEALKRLQPEPQDMYTHDYLYDCLSVLDSKAQVLLAYDGFLVAAASVVLTILPGVLTNYASGRGSCRERPLRGAEPHGRVGALDRHVRPGTSA